jgi:hypothetical protein
MDLLSVALMIDFCPGLYTWLCNAFHMPEFNSVVISAGCVVNRVVLGKAFSKNLVFT